MMSRFLEGMMPQSDSVFGLVENDLHMGRYTSAMMKLTVLSRDHSHDINFLNLLSRVQAGLADTRGLIKTLEVKSNLTQVGEDYLQLMAALYKEGRLNEALDVGLALQEMSLHPATYKDLTHYLIKIYMEFGDYEGIQEIVNTQTQDDFMLWAAGLVQLAYGDKNSALGLFRQSVESNAANDQAWVSLSLLHEEMGDRELALANLERALDANPYNATGLKLMSKWYRREPEQMKNVMGKVQYYLSTHAFDEEISLCYVQMLKENNSHGPAGFEIDKLILHNPANAEYRAMKKNLEDSFKI